MLKQSIILACLAAMISCKPAAAPKPDRTGQRVAIQVSGMHCGSCENAIKQGTRSCDGVQDVEASAAEQEVVVWMTPEANLEEVKARIASLGFKVLPSPND